MKKIIALILIFVLTLTFSSCKRPNEESSTIIPVQDEVAMAGDNSEVENENNDSAEQFDDKTVNKTETTTVTKTETVQTETEVQNEESTVVEEPTETEEVPQTESETPVEQEPEVTYEKKDFGNLEYPSDLYHKEYLPYSLGYVQKLQREDGSYYYRAKEDFITTEPVTDEIIEAAKKYPESNYALYDVTPGLHNIIYRDPIEPVTLETYEKYSETIVRGHFEEGHGSIKIAYIFEDQTLDNSIVNWRSNEYTTYNFVIDKIYDENCVYNVGDIIEVAYAINTIQQDYNGYYFSYGYNSFKNTTLEERTYVVSLNHSEILDMPTIDAICQNVYAEVEEGSIEYQILQKYN